MNPSQLAAQADRIASLCNIAARIANGENITGGLISDGGVGSIAQNGGTIDVDIDVSDFTWNRRGVAHTPGGAQSDIFSNPAGSVKQIDEAKTAGFPDGSNDPSDDEELKVVVIYGADADNASPALIGISATAWAADCAAPTDDEVKTVHGNDNYIKLGVITLKRAGASNTVVSYEFDHQNRLDQRDYELIDVNKV